MLHQPPLGIWPIPHSHPHWQAGAWASIAGWYDAHLQTWYWKRHCGECAYHLTSQRFFDFDNMSKDIRFRFQRAYSSFNLYCQAQGKSAGLRSFSKAFFNMSSLVSAPWANSKASDTILLLQWLVFVLKLQIRTPHVDGYNSLLSQMLQLYVNLPLNYGWCTPIRYGLRGTVQHIYTWVWWLYFGPMLSWGKGRWNSTSVRSFKSRSYMLYTTLLLDWRLNCYLGHCW